MNAAQVRAQASQFLAGATEYVGTLRGSRLSPLSLIALGALLATTLAELAMTADGLAVSAIMTRKIVSEAFVVSPDAPKGARRKVGDAMDSWTATSIEPSRVILKNGDRTAKLQLYADPPPVNGSGIGP